MPKQQNEFLFVIAHAIGGSIAGLITGLLLGIVIEIISLSIMPLYLQNGPQVIAPFLGMGFGTVIGAIFGGMFALKK